MLLQAGIGLGVAQGSIDDMLAVENSLGHVNQFLTDRPDEMAAELAEMRAQVMRLAETPYDGSDDYLVDVLDARVQVAEFAMRAAHSSLMHQGARGYLRAAAENPRGTIRRDRYSSH